MKLDYFGYFIALARKTQSSAYMRVLMGLTDRRKAAKNLLVDSHKNWKILTVSRK